MIVLESDHERNYVSNRNNEWEEEAKNKKKRYKKWKTQARKEGNSLKRNKKKGYSKCLKRRIGREKKKGLKSAAVIVKRKKKREEKVANRQSISKKKKRHSKQQFQEKKGCGSFFFLYCVPSMTLLCRFNRNTQHKLTETWWKMPTHTQRRQRNKFLVLRIKKCFAYVCVRVCWGCVTAVLMKKRTKKKEVFVKQIRTEKGERR